MSEGYWGGECEIKICCDSKKLEHCGFCKEFPCKILREISYDVDTGDDGERLMNCKKWFDDQSNEKWSFYSRILIGLSVGIILGAIIGIIQNMIAAWIFAGILIGSAIGLMLHINRKK